MQSEIFNQLRITQQQIKILIGSFLSMFIMVGLQYLGVHSPITFSNFPKFSSPVSYNNSLLNTFRPNIEKIQNNIYLKIANSLNRTTYASENLVSTHNQELLGFNSVNLQQTFSTQFGNFEIERR